MTDDAVIGPVDIRVPPLPSLSRVLRLAVGGMASLAGFTVDETEDIKIAVSEVLLALIEHGDGQSIEIQLSADGTSFDVRGHTAVESFDVEHPDLVLCRTVLAGVSTRHGVDRTDGHAHIWASVAHAPIA